MKTLCKWMHDWYDYAQKLILIMKLTFIIFFTGIMTINASSVYSQKAKLSLDVNTTEILDVLKLIEDQSEFVFIYEDEILEFNHEISLKVKESKIDKVLSKVFEGTDVVYEIHEKQIILKRKQIQKIPTKEPSSLEETQDSKHKVNGKVTDNNNVPIPGVSIVVKGTTQGTVTNADGKYSLPVPDNAILQFSFVGMKTQEFVVGSQTEINVNMEDETIGLQEVVAVGYGTMKKSDLTGAIASVSADDFKLHPVMDVSNVLQGRTPGVVVTTQSGMIGSSPKIRVRGTTSLNTSNNPLWVIDGIIGGTITNPNDIESIEVLKDASSTAIYGSRGANGVILVTTKRGKVGKTQFSISSNTGISNITKQWDLMDPYEFAVAYNDVASAGTFDADELQAYKNGTAGVDWVDLLTQTGLLQDYRLNISGGDEKTRFNISGNIVDQTGTLIESKFKRYNFKVNYDTKLTSWLRVFTDISLTNKTYHNPGDMDNFRGILDYAPTMEVLDEDGVCIEDTYNSIKGSPYAGRKYQDYDTKNHIANALLNFKADITEGLTFSALGNVLYSQTEYYVFLSSKRAPNATSSMTNSESRSLRWQTTENLTYKKDFDDHHLTLTGVFEASKVETPSLSISGTDLLSEKVYYWDVENAQTTSCSNGYSDESMTSVFVRGAYNYKSKYFITGTLRGDGSSKFQDDNKWGYFPSVAVAWDMTQENFMATQDIFQQIKLRGSYGVSGNQGIDPYATLGLMTREEYTYGTITTVYPGYWQSSYSTPGLSWEKTYQWDFGVNMTLLDQRLNITVDLYKKDTKDLLFEKSIPMYNGGGTYWTNDGRIKNKGFEFAIDASVINRSSFQWNSTINASHNTSEIIDIAGEEYITLGEGEMMGDGYIMKPGYSVGTFYLYDYAGIDDEGCNLYKTAEGGTTTSPSNEDKIIVGNSIPKWSFGWDNSFRWKNWEANVFFRSDLAVQKLNVQKFALCAMNGPSLFIRLNEAYDRSWDKVENKDDALHPSLTNGNNVYYAESTKWLENCAFLRCQNVTIAYRITKDLIGIGDLVLSAGATNLFTITKYSGMDPETVSSSNDDQQSGYDHGAYPLARTFNLGVKFNF